METKIEKEEMVHLTPDIVIKVSVCSDADNLYYCSECDKVIFRDSFYLIEGGCVLCSEKCRDEYLEKMKSKIYESEQKSNLEAR